MKRRIGFAITGIVVMLVLYKGCVIRTPEIHGTVVDAVTGQPVEGAWITGGLTLKSVTIAGDVNSYPSIERPHTRTGKDGKFVVPARTFMRIVIPVRLYTKVENFGIGARTADWRGGGANLTTSLWKLKTHVTIEIDTTGKDDEKQIAQYIKGGMTREKAEELIERDYFGSLQSLYSYCLSGRFSVEVPVVKEGCDDWELDYTIKKHEWYAERTSGLDTADQTSNYVWATKQLGYLYKKKGAYQKALACFKKIRALDHDRKVNLWLKEYDVQIQEIEHELRNR